VGRAAKSGARAWLGALAAGALVLLAAPAGAVDAEGILAGKCAACHDLKGPAPTTLKALWARKGPDLFYAGDKYREAWIAAWLQAPVRIRPAGMFYAEHIKATDQWDVVDESGLQAHISLPKDEAAAVAAALMQRKAKAALVDGVKVEEVNLSTVMGDLMFDKFKGCIACHRSGPDYGGASGPELYTAAKRLNPKYMWAYMQDPQAFDPKIWMPNMHLSPTDLNKLVRYLQTIAEGG
jgi:mono/diheme cytochrome c family protein